jgi:hypothetical protein
MKVDSVLRKGISIIKLYLFKIYQPPKQYSSQKLLDFDVELIGMIGFELTPPRVLVMGLTKQRDAL